MIKFTVLRYSVLIFVLFLLGFGSACQKVLNVEEAKQKPREAMLASMHRSLNYKSLRVESIYKQDFKSGQVNTETETIEYLLFPNKSDRWHSKYILDSGIRDPFVSEKILIDKMAYQLEFSNEWKKDSLGNRISNWGKLEDYLVLRGWDKEVQKTDVRFVGEESLDGVACAVFEYVAPGLHIGTGALDKKKPKHRAWVGVADGLFRKILIDGESDLNDGEKLSEVITFSFDDKNMKIEPPI